MINDLARRAVESSTCGPAGSFRRALYDTYGFARLPATLEYLLTGDESARERGLPADALGPFARRWDRVILMLVDGFGWRHFQQYAPRLPFLRRLLDEGLASPLTAQFPSTTAAHMTTLHTGLPVSRHGVWEWYYYEPLVDTVIIPLMYSVVGDKVRETLRGRPVAPEEILPGPRWYQALAARGITSTAFQDVLYFNSTYSATMFAGADRRGFENVGAGLTQLADVLLEGDRPGYNFFYIDGIDGKSHKYGLSSPEFEAAVLATFTQLEERLWQRAHGRAGDTLLVVSADHGQVPVDAAPPVYVNLALPDLLPLLRTNAAGETIRFAGSGRDLFLYVKDGRLAEAEAMLTPLLAGKATLWRCDEMLEQGLFGPPPFDRLRSRLGDLAILPVPGQGVFWQEEGKFTLKHKGSHGGLSPGEMDTGVYMIPL
jgi:hypothetical protein